MNSAINSFLPPISAGQRVLPKQNQPINSGFGSVLQSAAAVEATPASENLDVPEEELTALGELLDFLKRGTLMGEGEVAVVEGVTANTEEDKNSQLLQVLKKIIGNDEDGLPEFLSSIEELDLEQEQDDQDLKSLSVISGNLMELYTLLKKVSMLSSDEWQKLPMPGGANLLKLVKIQELLSENKEMSQDEAIIHKQMKNLLEGMTGKLEKWLFNQQKANPEPNHTNMLGTVRNNQSEILKSAFVPLSTAEKVSKEAKSGGGLALKTVDGGIFQGTGLPLAMTKLEQFVLTASKGEQTVSQEEFVKQFENILGKAHFNSQNGVNKLLIRLNPEHLGNLRIELIQKDGLLSARILATTSQAREMLEKQIHGLKQAFIGQNIQIDKIDISQAFTAFTSEKFLQKDADERHEQQQRKEESSDEGESEFTGTLAEALLNMEV
ncbi:flagellar hook-length control protein FliK [Peribacillus sp. SI8-4]|uniref:flagellar hook-length control protein FliK n=1 Tax=Peribacillus sp. SI8-4 TaxID=3048009 RepID=UPI002555DCA3|nr:flagellar hook-length control protein FliK [Peribacillus sp. SI8-4]